MIISASRRTDIPAFYSEWFVQRLRQQYCTVVNPYNKNQVSSVSLKPADVDVIVFWTKNAAPMMKYLQEIDQAGYRFYFQYTINGYDKIFEPNVAPLDHQITTFRRLAAAIGPEKVIWRYDPIILSNVTDELYHLERFSYILSQLQGTCCRVAISIVDDYRKAAINFKRLASDGVHVRIIKQREEVANLVSTMAQQAVAAGLSIYSCAEPFDLSPYGVRAGKCIDDNLIYELFHISIEAGKDKSQRLECGCVKSKDIGYYDTCHHGCSYCYAGTPQGAARRRAQHETASPSLIGKC